MINEILLVCKRMALKTRGTVGAGRAAGILFTTVCPGCIRTPLTADLDVPMPQLLEADAVASRILDAVRRRKAFFAFPARSARRLRFLSISLAIGVPGMDGHERFPKWQKQTHSLRVFITSGRSLRGSGRRGAAVSPGFSS
jgi:hypothetical protein